MTKTIQRAPQFGNAFSKGFQLAKENMGFLIVGGLISNLVGNLLCGLLTPGFTCGLYGLLMSKIRTGNEIKATDIFNEGFKRFLPALASVLAFAIIGVITSCTIVAPVVVGGLLSYSLLLVGDGADVKEAITEPFKQLGKKSFWIFFLINLVAGIIAMAGILLCFVGVFFTVPLAYCILTVAYEEMTSEDGQPQSEPTAAIPDAPAQ